MNVFDQPPKAPGLVFLIVWLSACIFTPVQAHPSSTLPRPDHIVIVIKENHSYSQIMGSSAAPYINTLAEQGALFTQSFGVAHYSQPNYLVLFSGAGGGTAEP